MNEETAARAAELLEPYDPLARVVKHRLCDEEILNFAGESEHSLYRAVESHALRCERAEAPPRKDGRRGASRIFVTLRDIAVYRASRFTPANEEAGPIRKTKAPAGTGAKRNHKHEQHSTA